MLDCEHIFCYTVPIKNKCFGREERCFNMMGQAVKHRKRYRIKSHTRFIMSLLIMAAILVTVFGTLTGLNRSVAITVPEYEYVQVENGDTLWDIAGEYKSADTDTRRAVYEICRVNDIEATDLYPGMTISIPEDL